MACGLDISYNGSYRKVLSQQKIGHSISFDFIFPNKQHLTTQSSSRFSILTSNDQSKTESIYFYFFLGRTHSMEITSHMTSILDKNDAKELHIYMLTPL